MSCRPRHSCRPLLNWLVLCTSQTANHTSSTHSVITGSVTIIRSSLRLFFTSEYCIGHFKTVINNIWSNKWTLGEQCLERSAACKRLQYACLQPMDATFKNYRIDSVNQVDLSVEFNIPLKTSYVISEMTFPVKLLTVQNTQSLA